MAISVNIVSQIIGAGGKRTVADVTLDDSYPTAGEAVTADQVKMHNVTHGYAQVKTVSGTRNISSAHIAPQTDGSFKVKCHDETPAEVTSTNSLADCVIRCTVDGF